MCFPDPLVLWTLIASRVRARCHPLSAGYACTPERSIQVSINPLLSLTVAAAETAAGKSSTYAHTHTSRTGMIIFHVNPNKHREGAVPRKANSTDRQLVLQRHNAGKQRSTTPYAEASLLPRWCLATTTGRQKALIGPRYQKVARYAIRGSGTRHLASLIAHPRHAQQEGERDSVVYRARGASSIHHPVGPVRTTRYARWTSDSEHARCGEMRHALYKRLMPSLEKCASCLLLCAQASFMPAAIAGV